MGIVRNIFCGTHAPQKRFALKVVESPRVNKPALMHPEISPEMRLKIDPHNNIYIETLGQACEPQRIIEENQGKPFYERCVDKEYRSLDCTFILCFTASANPPINF